MKLQNFNKGFCYPFDLLDNLQYFPSQHAIPCSVLYNDGLVGGLLLQCEPADLNFFGINRSNQPEPFLKFRMLNIMQQAYAIEIHLVFQHNRVLKIHLNPVAHQTIEFLKVCSETKWITFHFNERSSKFFASSITLMTTEHSEWFKRNYNLVKNLSPVNDYLLVCQALFSEMQPNQRLYHYFEKDGVDCFVRKGALVAKFDDTNESSPMETQKKSGIESTLRLFGK